MADTRLNQAGVKKTRSVEPAQEFVELDELEELEADSAEESQEADATEDSKLLFAKSTDVRRRIEERLEVRMLRDELGMDDFDL